MYTVLFQISATNYAPYAARTGSMKTRLITMTRNQKKHSPILKVCMFETMRKKKKNN